MTKNDDVPALTIVQLSTVAPHNLQLPQDAETQPALFLFSDQALDDQAQFTFIHDDELSGYLNMIASAEYVAFAETHMVQHVLTSALELIRELQTQSSGFIALVRHKDPPTDMRRYDGAIASFISKGLAWSSLIQEAIFLQCNELCYTIFKAILARTLTVETLLVRQLPLAAAPLQIATTSYPNVAVIIPHYHSVDYLLATLDYVGRMQWPSQVSSAVGLDIFDISPYTTLIQEPGMRFYRCPTLIPAGPYVFREALISDSSEHLVLFQDSDDLPCSDRLLTLFTGLITYQADMVGSHELEVNEITRKVQIYRFPLDVSAILSGKDVAGVSDNAAEPFLHATAIMKRDSFVEVGGFSTNRRIANDSQFLLRASFSLSIVNVDAFLYIRRVHKAALTVAPETHNGNQTRKELSSKWGTDFRNIKKGQLRLSDSSLVADKAFPKLQVERM